jgi:hypothetical protein
VLAKMGKAGNKIDNPQFLFTYKDAKTWAVDMAITQGLVDTLGLGFMFDFLPDGKYHLT